MTFLHKIYNSYTATSLSLDLTDDENNVAVKLDWIYAIHSTAHTWFLRNFIQHFAFSEATFQTGDKDQSYQAEFKLQE